MHKHKMNYDCDDVIMMQYAIAIAILVLGSAIGVAGVGGGLWLFGRGLGRRRCVLFAVWCSRLVHLKKL